MDVSAIALFPFVIIKKDYKDHPNLYILKNHETIHFRQALELLVIPFYILYVLMFLFNVFKYFFNFQKAYRKIPFEKEAYTHEWQKGYLKERKLYSWTKYF